MEAPEFFQPPPPADHFIVEDLLDFSNEDPDVSHFNSSVAGDSIGSSSVTAVDSCNSSSLSGSAPNFAGDVGCRSFIDGQFADDLCVPYDDLAELEWLSNFAEESFSSEDLQKLQLISGMKTRPTVSSDTRGFQHELRNQIDNVIDSGDNSLVFRQDMTVPAKARSKRSRAVPCNWASHLLVLSPTISSSEPDIVVLVQPPPQNHPGKKPVKTTSSKKKDGGEASSDGRKCLHCATDKTPQWRTGPMGPKTLCNACGVRYKSGRLVPEYRPAASPTFVLTKHSNSHRKVLELRRQKEMVRAQHQFMHHHHHQNMIFDVSNGDDYLIHQPMGHDFRQLI
ncbi:GATA transcription factor 12 [Hibiscus syriacus]|uniref:GATA transcription factor n=1 Tax=Hibiscus syriacus TaxID=106335 RepID=A0A6A2Z7D9_HIBSY|nr:GATA transcription factor 12-like [Hibiscus syriacus]KAE8687818.1 GATA transcription factor 12 [Hibiscus syriacus]